MRTCGALSRTPKINVSIEGTQPYRADAAAYLAWLDAGVAPGVRGLESEVLVSEQQKCESCEVLRKALQECAERFKRCLVESGTDPEFAEAAIADYREILEDAADA